MEEKELKEMFDNMRAQIVGFEAEIAALKKVKGGSADDRKINAEMIEALKAEIAAIRAEMPTKTPPAAPGAPAAKKEDAGLFGWISEIFEGE